MNRHIALNQALVEAQSAAGKKQLERNSDCAQLLSALGDPIRLRIITTLVDGPAAVTEIAESIQCDLAKTSHHLRVLKRMGLVEIQRDGKHLIQSLRPGFAIRGRGKAPLRFDLGCCNITFPKE